jgi:hypothetical protein
MIDAGEFFDVSFTCLLVEPFRVTLFGGLDGTFHVYKNEFTFILDDITGLLLGITEWGDHSNDDRNIVAIQQLCNVGGSAVVSSTILPRKPKIRMKMFSNLVSIEILDGIPHLDETIFDTTSECRFPG